MRPKTIPSLQKQNRRKNSPEQKMQSVLPSNHRVQDSTLFFLRKMPGRVSFS